MNWIFFLRWILCDCEYFIMKTANVRYLYHIMLLFLSGYRQVHDSGGFWQVLWLLPNFPFLVITFEAVLVLTCCQYATTIPAVRVELVVSFLYFMTFHLLLFWPPLKINVTDSSLKKPDSMSPELKLILQTGAENPSWKKITERKVKWIKLSNLK